MEGLTDCPIKYYTFKIICEEAGSHERLWWTQGHTIWLHRTGCQGWIKSGPGEASAYSLQSSDWIGSRPPYSELWWSVIPHQNWPWYPGEIPACAWNLLSSSHDAKNCLSKTQTSPPGVLTVCTGPSCCLQYPSKELFLCGYSGACKA